MAKKNVTVYKVLISCPSDVKEFVPGIEQAIYRFNRINGLPKDIMLLPVYYVDSAYSALGDHPQSLLNKQIVDDADLAISVFWKRFGSPTKHYDSGTQEEISYMLEKGKQVFLYFLNLPFVPDMDGMEQYMKLLQYKKNVEMSSLPTEVESTEQLYNKIYDQLGHYFNQKINGDRLKKSAKKSRILWVDDRPENNVLERRTLERYGVEVLVALSTDQAMALLETNDISLIISDMGRKEGPNEGYVLLEKVRKTNQTIPYYIFAGSSDPKYDVEAKKRGAQASTGYSDVLLDMVIKSLLN